MKNILVFITVVALLIGCGNSNESAAGSDTTVSSTTPPAKTDTNPIGIMMGDTTIGINDSLKK